MDSFGAGIIFALVLLVGFFIILGWMIPIPLFIAARFSGVKVSLSDLIGMRMRKVNPYHIIEPMIQAVKGGVNVTIKQLENHYMAGGNVKNVISALIAAKKADIPLSFERATSIDLAGRDLFEAIQMAVNPKVITTPPVSAVAKDGIEVIITARVTVKANINRLVGGADTAVILARIGEAIASTIGAAKSHKEILENPDKISKKVIEKGADANTAFFILSVDIADVDVGRNIGAKLKADQSKADKEIAQARAEQKRTMAIARKQEMLAYQQEMLAKLEAAKAEVPKAMAYALKSGKLGIMDYYKLKNLIADTSMRESISMVTSGTVSKTS